MKPIFEAKYLAIKWKDKNTVSDILESINPIKIEVENTTSYKMEIQTYKRIEDGSDGQIAFHFLNEKNDIQPYFINANNEKIYLIKIKGSGSEKEWWIEDGVWSKKDNRKFTELWNHVGETTIYFDNILCHINISAISFTREQLDLYLEDFKNDFWYLILKKNSLTQANAKNSIEEIKILNNETVAVIKKYIQYIEYILKNPKKELKEIQELKDIKKVKPVAKTFKEILLGGIKQKLTSRDTFESYNVTENKYIHYTIYQVSIILFNMNRTSQYMNNFYQNKVKSEQKRFERFTDTKIIDKKIIENAIVNLNERINKIKDTLLNIEQLQDKNIIAYCEQEMNKPTLQDCINIAIQNQNIQQLNNNVKRTFHIKLESKQDDTQNKIKFLGKIKNIDEQEWQGSNTNDKYSLEFNLEQFQFLRSFLGREFKITANVKYSCEKNITDDYFFMIIGNKRYNLHKFYFINITEFKPLNFKKSEITIKHQTLHIRLNKKQDNKYLEQIQFWGDIKLENDKEWYKLKKDNSFSLAFDFDIFNNILQENTEYKISAYIESYYETPKIKKIHKRYFKYITKIEQLTDSTLERNLNYYMIQKKQLEKTNWIKPLNNIERREQEKEKEAIKKQIQILNEESQTANECIKQLEPLIQVLKKILNQFNQLSIVKDSYFPNSMTFIKNPNYQGAYKYYELIKNIVGIDENLFLSIQKVDKIGILDIPKLYERWCFLQIIKILIHQYHFLPEADWKQKLIYQMLGNTDEVKKDIRNIFIEFENTLLQRKIILHYEKELNGKNSKRPDYVLEIVSLRTKKKHNLIIDAKFKESVNIKNLIEELYHKKDYSQKNTNTVFILHPDTNNSIKQLNPSVWGNDAYYGEVEMFDYQWDNDKFPNHKYGSILLSPIRNKNEVNYGNYLDNLQRLIGMAMQYQLEDNQNIINNDKLVDPEPHERIFCLKCGSTEFQGEKIFTKNKKGFKYNLICNNCKHVYIYNYCQSCKTRIIKNGQYWSYHATEILEPFNINCPNCNQIYIRDNGE